MKKLFILPGIFTLLAVQAVLAQDTTSTKLQLHPTDDKAHAKFTVTDFNNVPEQGAIIKILSTDQTYKTQGVADIDGHFETLLPEGKDYAIKIEKFGKVFDMGVMPIPVEDAPLTIEQGLQISVVTKYIRVYKLENVYFDTGKSNIKPESYPSLDKLVFEMKNKPTMVIEIAGHTDNVGDDQNNMRLSQSRAVSAKQYLESKGIASNRLIAKGYGETAPVSTNETPEGRQLNRRTEVKVISE